MGTVLHPGTQQTGNLNISGFSPLLDGDGVASVTLGSTVTLKSSFSPLLDGDGVASRHTADGEPEYLRFQSPSRWGRCCIHAAIQIPRIEAGVSVPFSMGTVLH